MMPREHDIVSRNAPCGIHVQKNNAVHALIGDTSHDFITSLEIACAMVLVIGIRHIPICLRLYHAVYVMTMTLPM